MGNKEEFNDLYALTMAEFKENIAYLESIEEQIKEQAGVLKALDAIPECDEDTRVILNEVYKKLNAINKNIRKIRQEKEVKKQKLDPYFRVFGISHDEYIQLIIELNDLIKKYQPIVGKQIMKCFNYLNDRGIDIVL